MIRTATIRDSYTLAQLHDETLETSFLASLGIEFLSKLYAYIISYENVWIFEENNIIFGFVSFSTNSGLMMKRFFYTNPGCFFILVRRLIMKPSNIIRFIETSRAPSKVNNIPNSMLPVAELLSISVRPGYQALGIGNRLLIFMENYLKGIGISQYKVVAGATLLGANKFYLKNGFVLSGRVCIHGNSVSNVYMKNVN
jgi:GNAT superfamily N-acetyltransferase